MDIPPQRLPRCSREISQRSTESRRRSIRGQASAPALSAACKKPSPLLVKGTSFLGWRRFPWRKGKSPAIRMTASTQRKKAAVTRDPVHRGALLFPSERSRAKELGRGAPQSANLHRRCRRRAPPARLDEWRRSRSSRWCTEEPGETCSSSPHPSSSKPPPVPETKFSRRSGSPTIRTPSICSSSTARQLSGAAPPCRLSSTSTSAR